MPHRAYPAENLPSDPLLQLGPRQLVCMQIGGRFVTLRNTFQYIQSICLANLCADGINFTAAGA